jgi:hypothetical protein
MVVSHVPEPCLEFGNGGLHPDIRFGLIDHGPQDTGQEIRRPEKIRIGIVGSPESIDGTAQWLERCKSAIAAKDSSKRNLFPAFPGFNEDCCFRSSTITDESLTQTILPREYTQGDKDWPYENRISHAARAFSSGIEQLAEKNPDVILLAMPSELVTYLSEAEANRIKDKNRLKMEFHDLVKGISMKSGKPVQILRPSTYDPSKKSREKDERSQQRSLQDEATRAWNFHTALYYKAGGFPYRVPRPESAYSTCYIGISFFFSPDKSKAQASVANVFNERGHGLAVRGKDATFSKDDRQYHLSAEDAAALIADCLKAYRSEHKNSPARVVIHKSSPYSPGELEGFHKTLEDAGIDIRDFLSLSRSFTRLYRAGYYPPLRGTALHADSRNIFLYTRGSVDFYQEYPGMYVPRSLGIRIAEMGSKPKTLLEELMVLSKTNWNNVQIDATMPITITAAQTVGNILRWLPEGSPTQMAYKFYM